MNKKRINYKSPPKTMSKYESFKNHIFISKGLGKIKILCLNDYYFASNLGKNNSRWFINSHRQYSLNAGYNSNCEECLKLFLKKVNKDSGLVINKLITNDFN